MKKLVILCIPIILVACASATEWADNEAEPLCVEGETSSKSASSLYFKNVNISHFF